jgi:hypothetical protein
MSATSKASCATEKGKGPDISGMRRVALKEIAQSENVDAIYKEVAAADGMLVFSIDGKMVIAKKGPTCLSIDRTCKHAVFIDRDPLYMYPPSELASLVLYNRADAAMMRMKVKEDVVVCYNFSQKVVDNYGNEKVVSEPHDVCAAVKEFPVCDTTIDASCNSLSIKVADKKAPEGSRNFDLCQVRVKDSKKFPTESAAIEQWRSDYCEVAAPKNG